MAVHRALIFCNYLNRIYTRTLFFSMWRNHVYITLFTRFQTLVHASILTLVCSLGIYLVGFAIILGLHKW
jgi:hypothetical protein